MTTWHCVIPGQPIGKGRPRVARRGSGVVAYTPAPTRRWEAIAATTMAQEWGIRAPLDEPAQAAIVARFSRPQRLICKHKRACSCSPEAVPHVTRPDADNVAKAVLDAAQAGGVLRDDCLVWQITVVKTYAAQDSGPAVELRLWWGE